jgi:hypothetical protein
MNHSDGGVARDLNFHMDPDVDIQKKKSSASYIAQQYSRDPVMLTSPFSAGFGWFHHLEARLNKLMDAIDSIRCTS